MNSATSSATPWGRMSYIEYRYRVEFGLDEYEAIDAHCREGRGILWFVSCWDVPSLEFMETFELPVYYKVASASHHGWRRCSEATARLGRVRSSSPPACPRWTGDPTRRSACSTGRELLITHTTSTYPCPPEPAQPAHDRHSA